MQMTPRKRSLRRTTKNPKSVKRRERRDRKRAREAPQEPLPKKIVGEDAEQVTMPPPPPPPAPPATDSGQGRKIVLREEEIEKYYAKIGKNWVGAIDIILQKRQKHQTQILAPLLRKTVTTKKNSESYVPPAILTSLLNLKRSEKKDEVKVVQIEQLVQRGTDEKLDGIMKLTRERKKRGCYQSDLEVKCSLKWLASLGEVMSSSSTRYRLMISRPEVYRMYSTDGIKTILYSMLVHSEVYQETVQSYARLNEEQKEARYSVKGQTHAMYCIDLWARNNFQGECPPFAWKRSRDKFWEIINMREEGSRKKMMKTYFSTKLHPCPHCKEWEEEIIIFEDLQKAYLDESDQALKALLKARLDQWSSKIETLKVHKDKHETQRAAVQKWRLECKSYPGVCLVYEDFCNLYEANDAKMLNLVMVLVFWDPTANKGKGDVVEEYYDTFCRGSLPANKMGDYAERGSQDNNVYRDCWIEAFEAKIFERFHTVIKTGDNGSALKSYDTFYLHCVLMVKYNIRIFYFTLCPYHAENLCDPHGAHTKKAIKKYERKTGEETGSAAQTAAARNMYRGPKVKEAKFCESYQEYNEYTPEEMVRKKQKNWPYSLRKCCVVFFQVTNIHENVEHPRETIELGAVGYGAPCLKHAFGVFDLRWDTLLLQKVCLLCSERFDRTVLRKDHNQKGFYLCPKTLVYRQETDLDRLCPHCNEKVRDAHTESPNQSDACPTQALKDAGQMIHTHKSFCVISINSPYPQRYEIKPRPEKVTASSFTTEQLAELKSRYHKPKVVHEKKIEPGSVAEARMMAPGITVAYQVASKAGQLRWGIGVCVSQDKKQKVFEIQVFSPSEPEVTRAPWCKWNATDDKITLTWTDKTWLKVPKLGKKCKIPTKALHLIRKDPRFSWQWISRLDLASVPDPGDIEFAPHLDTVSREH